MANYEWMTLFLTYRASNLDFFRSDHRPVIINTSGPNRDPSLPRIKLFSFNHQWLLEDDHYNFTHLWRSNTSGDPLHSKLRNLAQAISSWAEINVGSLPKEIKKLRARIYKIRENATFKTDGYHLGTLEAKLEKVQSQEKIYWHQRSRVN